MLKEEKIEIFNGLADKIESRDKKKIFLEKYRKKIIPSATGRVLEVAVGSGNNFSFYPAGVEVVAVDFSPPLLELAKKSAVEHDLEVEFINSDVEKLDFPEDYFDTIVSTLSLCTYKNPIQVLNNFNKWCKEDGQILLLEHGLISNRFYSWPANKLFDLLNNWHLKKRGCHLNLDIIEIITASNLRIESKESSLLGIHDLIWARPQKSLL